VHKRREREVQNARERKVQNAVSARTIGRDGERLLVGPRPLLAMDPWLMVAAVGLVAFSAMTLKGAAGSSFYEHQAAFAALGVVVVLIVARIDYSRMREYRFVLFGLLIAANVLVYGMAPRINGARRWIPLPFLEFQPSEFGKLLLIVSLAAFAVSRGRMLSERRNTARIMLLALLAAMLVIPQPDIGTGLVYVFIGLSILYFGGTSWKHLTALALLFALAIALVLAVAPALGVHVLKPYQEQRLTSFLHQTNNCPINDPTCYQLNQSKIAIGSGQKTGLGVAGATQARFNFLPEGQNDFIFAVIGETYGFAGAALVLSLYALLIWRTLRILTLSKNLFGTLIAGGILAMLMFQVFVNVGMTIGIMPVTGVPLPLMSYGGSSVLVTFLAVGLLQSIHVQARIASAGKARTLIS
jgi:rod shape determining protein RodA